jgi:stearoyl-CoA desaturase (delta-9 desaturase)
MRRSTHASGYYSKLGEADLDTSISGKLPPETTIGEEFVPVHMRITMLVVVVVPFLGLIAGIILLWGHGFSWAQLAIFIAMYFLSGLGMTVGFHRLFTHRSFETIRPVKLVLGILGSMSVEGPLLKWVATHRRHHQLSDTADDPHSPHVYGTGFMPMLRGFWHAHLGWIFGPESPRLTGYIKDLLPDRLLRTVSVLFPVWAILGLVIPAVLGGLLTRTWLGVLMGFLWGGLARIFIVQHLTFSINSVCHIWGRRPLRSRDESRNNAIFGVFGFGEGWHNNHHAFPTSARHGFTWWQIDISYMVIRAMKAVRLAWKVRVPRVEAIAAKLREPAVSDMAAA